MQTNTNTNLDVFFYQNDNVKIGDALIDQLFESARKPIIQSQPQTYENQNPLNSPQQMNQN